MKIEKNLMFFLIPGIFLFSSCGGEKCKPQIIERENSGSEISLQKGKTVEFAVSATSCVGDFSFSFTWTVNGVIQGYENTFKYFACDDPSGEVEIKVIAKNRSGEFAEKKWMVNIEDPGKILKPGEVQKALSVIQGTHNFHPDDPDYSKSVSEFAQAVTILDYYLNVTNACDIDVNYASGVGRTSLLLTKAPEFYEKRFERGMRPEEVFQLIDEELIPLLDRLNVVRRYAPKNFSFKIDYLYIVIFKDLPDPGSQFLAIDLSGEHDYTDVLFLSSAAEAGVAGLHIMLAFNGILEFILSIPRPEDVTLFTSYAKGLTDEFVLEKEVIKKLEEDPAFLILAPPDERGLTGETHLSIARVLLANSLRTFESALESLISEKITDADKQDDDLIRYWDCGKDGVCPGDMEERSNPNLPCEDQQGNQQAYTDWNINGKCNPPHCDKDGDGQLDLTPDTNPYDPKNESTCVAPDEGEGNGQFDSGEPAGIDRIQVFSNAKRRYSLPVQQWVRNDLLMIADNIEGVDNDGDGEPDPLNLNALVPGFDVVKAMTLYGIPVPEIRISEFFITPSNLRDLVPLYARPQCDYAGFEGQIILSNEFEPFDDNGYDGKWSWEEPGYDELLNRDPNHDDFDPVCDPVCNENDGYDNDQDGRCTPNECNKCRSLYGPNFPCDDSSSVGVSTDGGVEANYKWDCKSPVEVERGLQCLSDHERFSDQGIFDGRDWLYKNDGIYTRDDIVHKYPYGTCVGGKLTEVTEDPRNGSQSNNIDEYEKNGKLYDPFYVFFPDPTFSGALRFPDDIVNPDGQKLNKNAKLMRFITKIYNLALSFGLIE